jgi:hypothetical protein
MRILRPSGEEQRDIRSKVAPFWIVLVSSRDPEDYFVCDIWKTVQVVTKVMPAYHFFFLFSLCIPDNRSQTASSKLLECL